MTQLLTKKQSSGHQRNRKANKTFKIVRFFSNVIYFFNRNSFSTKRQEKRDCADNSFAINNLKGYTDSLKEDGRYVMCVFISSTESNNKVHAFNMSAALEDAP
jgi:hypothetical protein